MSRKTRSGKSSSAIIFALIGVLAFLAISCGLFYAVDKGSKDVVSGGEKNKEGIKVVNLVDESIEAHRVLDNILLKKNNWQLIEKWHGEDELGVEGATSRVKMNRRSLAVGVPGETSLAGAGAWLKEKVETSGLAYINGRPDKYRDYDAYRVEVGIKTKAGQETRSFTTDTLWFFHNTNLQKQDKDVKKLPYSSAKELRQYKGRLAIIVDDCGNDMSSLRTLLDTGLPFSYAVLPYKEYSNDCLEMIKTKGRVPLLHLPMEPVDRKQMSEGGNSILVSMSAEKKRAMVRKAIERLPGVVGINNHQGSRATSDKATMEAVLKEAKAHKLFFVDSKTIASSVARDTAKAMGVYTARNDIFLDSSTDIEKIRMQIYKAMELAEKQGDAVAICHARPNTARCWKQYLDEFKYSGINFVPITELLY